VTTLEGTEERERRDFLWGVVVTRLAPPHPESGFAARTFASNSSSAVGLSHPD
jgi:hypothetical protein